MDEQKVYRAIGLMSGTSLDGEIDVALLETDGRDHVKVLDFYAHPYDGEVRDAVRSCFGKRNVNAQTLEAEALVTRVHGEAVKASGFQADVIGFHGQTVTHDPKTAFTWQLGDGEALAEATGMTVVHDFRQADMRAGGQGAPLAPLYHQAIMAAQDKPVVVLNIGGVSNVSYIGANGALIAFDCGPGNALMDDYIREKLAVDYDVDGAFAASGHADMAAVELFLQHPYFNEAPPKSLDRDTFKIGLPDLPFDPQSALATLAAFTVAGIQSAVAHFPDTPHAWYVCGGGARNAHLMRLLREAFAPAQVEGIEAAGYNGDAIEAECFAYLAVRSMLSLPLSMPSTTGVNSPTSGGVINLL